MYYLDNLSLNWVIRDPLEVLIHFSYLQISILIHFSLSIGSQTLDHIYHVGCNGSGVVGIHNY